MEKPYEGRAIIQDNITDLQITIPVKRNWFVTIFLAGWLGCWFLGETFALVTVLGVLRGNPAGLFVLFWLVAWTAGGFFAFRAFLWNLRGKEVVTIGQGQLTIDKKGIPFYKPKIYDLKEVKNIRAQDTSTGADGTSGGRRSDLGVLNSGGTIRFDYGLQTVKFADDIDEAEARSLIDKLKERHLLTERNYS